MILFLDATVPVDAIRDANVQIYMVDRGTPAPTGFKPIPVQASDFHTSVWNEAKKEEKKYAVQFIEHSTLLT